VEPPHNTGETSIVASTEHEMVETTIVSDNITHAPHHNVGGRIFTSNYNFLMATTRTTMIRYNCCIQSRVKKISALLWLDDRNRFYKFFSLCSRHIFTLYQVVPCIGKLAPTHSASSVFKPSSSFQSGSTGVRLCIDPIVLSSFRANMPILQPTN
jgi:hypothetical protein